MRKELTLILLTSLLALAACTAETEVTETEIAEEAACVLNPPKKPGVCTMEYAPVCGCDGKTYGNACSARGAGVPSHTPGECPDQAD